MLGLRRANHLCILYTGLNALRSRTLSGLSFTMGNERSM